MANTSNHLGTPSYPRAPHPTPSSNTKHPPHGFNSRLPRPPVQNPFDKFSQDDFDTWIGKLTGDLQRALGYEDEPQPSPAPYLGKTPVGPPGTEEEDYLEGDSVLEDSFAQVKARHALNKGKARDPREGPGLGPKSGDKDQPIEILTDEEDQEDIEAAEGSYEEDEGEYEEGDEEEEWLEDEHSPATQALDSLERRNRKRHELFMEGEDELSEQLDEGGSEDEHENGEYEDEHEDGSEARDTRRVGSEEVVELLSDDEALETGYQLSVDNRQHLQLEEEDEFLSDEERAVDDQAPPVLDDRDLRKDKLAEDAVQPLDDDTSFPPHPNTHEPGSSTQPVDIPDPWAAVAKYAEDYYSGGDVRPDSNDNLDPHHLGLNDDEPRFSSLEGDVEQEGYESDEREIEAGHPPFARRKMFHYTYQTGSPPQGFSARTQVFSGTRDQSGIVFPEPPYSAPGQEITSHGFPLHKSSPEIIAIDSEEETEEHAPVQPEPLGHAATEERVQEEPTVVLEVPNLGEASSEPFETCPTPVETASAQRENRDVLKQMHEEGHLPSSVLGSQVNEKVGNELPSPPRSPITQATNPFGSDETLDKVNELYANTNVSIEASQKELSGAIEDLVNWTLPSVYTQEFATSASARLVTPPIDQEAFALGHSSAHIHTSAQVTGAEEVEDEDGTEHPGAFPLMTSDLDYEAHIQSGIQNDEFEEEGAQPLDVIPPSFEEMFQQPTSNPLETMTTEEYIAPAEIIEVGTPDMKIFIEESEDYTDTPPEEIIINVKAATPMIWSRSNSPKVDEELHLYGQESTVQSHLEQASVVPKSEGIPEVIEGRELPDPVLQPLPQENTSGNLAAGDQIYADMVNMPPLVVDQSMDEVFTFAQDPTKLDAGGIAGPSEAVWRNIDVGVEEAAITEDQSDASRTIKNQDSSDASDDQIAYTVEEPLTESERYPSVVPERDTSVGVISVQSNEVDPAAVEKGDLELVSESEEGATVPLDINQTPTSVNVHEPYGIYVEDLQVTEQAVHTLETEVGEQNLAYVDPVPSPSPDPNDYFTQPGSPVPPVTPTALPSIINLPGTPHRVLSPAGTPGPGPTPVSISVEPAVLKALRANPNFLDPTSPPARGSLPSSAQPQTRQPLIAEASPTTASVNINSSQQPAFTGPSPPTSPTVHSEFGAQPTTDGAPSFFPVVTASNPTHPTLAADPYPYSLSTPTATNQQFPTVSPSLITAFTAYPDLGARPITNGVPSSPDTSARRPADPVLIADPYPYSLSTPMSPNMTRQEEEEGSEEDTGQDNSMASSSTAEKDGEDKVSDTREEEAIPVNVDGLELRYPSEPSIAGDTRDTPTAGSIIDEFLVGESESDTDADGEADPEFLGAGPGVDLVTPQDAQADALDESDPFKLMGNDSLVAPGEASDSTPDEEQGKDSTDMLDMMTPEPESVTQPTEEVQELLIPPISVIPSATTTTESGNVLAPGPEQPPLDSVAAPPTEIEPVPIDSGVLDLNEGVLPHLPAANHQPPTPSHKTPPLEPVTTTTITTTTHPPEKEDQASIPSAGVHTPPSAGASTLQQPPAPAHSTTPVEDPRRKVHISVEDPYHADNDSDHENVSNTSKSGKRKRSLSNASDHDSPSPTKSKPASTSRGRAKSTGPAAKAARPRKDGSKRSATHNVFYTSNAASRSPSIASTVPSDHSFLTQPSPNTDRPPVLSSEPRPFLHAHSRRKRAKVPTTLQEQKELKKTPSLPRSRAGILKAEDVLTKAPSISTANTSSPVTRSHCRYHKISIPKTEHGPPVFFLVPGCSLTDQTLIVEEEIEDHGEAIIRGDTRIVDDIETLDFEPYLLWVMRQLVGRDIMQENEVFYLPELNEEVVRKSPKQKKKQASRPQKNSSATAGNATDSARESSVASTISVLRQVLGGSDAESLSTVTETEDEAKSPTRKPQHENGGTGSLKRADQHQEKDSSQSKGVNTETTTSLRKRVRRLGQDAAAYQPPSDGSLSEDPDYDAPHRKPIRNRGFKRSRLPDAHVVEGVDIRRVKKPKTQPSISEEVSHAV